MSTFQNKVALVTGGTSGIGRATAIAFAKAGAKVVISGRREKEGSEVIAEIKAAGGEAIFVRGDVANEADAQALVEKTVAAYGRLDAAFNNAGIEGATGLPTAEQTAENFDQIFGINVRGLLFTMKYEIAQMLKNGGGAIVNNSSIAGHIGFPGMGVYVASKHAVLGLTKTAALEYAKTGIRVNAVCPGVIETAMIERFVGPPDAASEMRAQITAGHPIGRTGRVEEIAGAVLFLCSDAASFIVGQDLPVDGGWLAQ